MAASAGLRAGVLWVLSPLVLVGGYGYVGSEMREVPKGPCIAAHL